MVTPAARKQHRMRREYQVVVRIGHKEIEDRSSHPGPRAEMLVEVWIVDHDRVGVVEQPPSSATPGANHLELGVAGHGVTPWFQAPDCGQPVRIFLPRQQHETNSATSSSLVPSRSPAPCRVWMSVRSFNPYSVCSRRQCRSGDTSASRLRKKSRLSLRIRFLRTNTNNYTKGSISRYHHSG